MSRYIAGFDEAGRGPLAGPVCAAVVVYPAEFTAGYLNDSKKMTEKRRIAAVPQIFTSSVVWGIGWASAAEIDEINILQASLLAMKRAWDCAFLKNPVLELGSVQGIADGIFIPNVPIPCTAMPRADSAIEAVMAASILAKTARDRMMIRYSWLYPEYGYEKHKGYPTEFHREALKRNGPSPLQRTSFRLTEKTVSSKACSSDR